MPKQDLKEMMKEKAQAVQSVVSEVGSIEEAFRYAIDITRKQGGTVLAAPGLGRQDASAFAAFRALCEQNGVALVKESLRAEIGKLHTGFTVADYGIAETATIVQESSCEDLRIATMLSEIHVAVLPAARIKPNAMALENELKGEMKSAPSYLAFISGASRTADIERELTIGVHGPQELHILILDGDQA
ncbi:LutC/YkgG family protein [Desulfoferrobacter suflitae]|uniref:LutC/YkgG family protein n=1 Tax=Desulfoferrobacter suflitae TaxID=2865782 RepID=UPI002164AECC|nr:lactate utilization protein [Desulfoferrobacter suflitae]MCK8604333.1 lactate utilization protein [Desulfoferrobacter suflitae]